MAAAVSAYTIVAGKPQRLAMAAGETREFLLSFVEPDDSPNAGHPVYLADAAMVRMHLNLAGVDSHVDGTVIGPGIVSFLAMIDSAQVPVVGSVDVVSTDATGNKYQILVASEFEVLQSVSA